jgi:hypothetical protein
MTPPPPPPPWHMQAVCAPGAGAPDLRRVATRLNSGATAGGGADNGGVISISDGLADWVAKALRRTPAERHASAADMERALHAALVSSQPVPPPPPTTTTTMTTPMMTIVTIMTMIAMTMTMIMLIMLMLMMMMMVVVAVVVVVVVTTSGGGGRFEQLGRVAVHVGGRSPGIVRRLPVVPRREREDPGAGSVLVAGQRAPAPVSQNG